MTATAPAPTASFGPLTDADFARYAGATQTLASGSETPGDAPSFTSSTGPLAAALLATYATDWLGSETVRRFRTRCARPLWPGDTLTCSGYVVRAGVVVDGGPHGRVQILEDLRHHRVDEL
ncbi:hypothetical protein, partial [Nocardia cyriacigeorgica]|uniref:hypothetical protein n=1 Tax=Nocardia cyriacigeorgica TaxID=135487 RepID=UPI002458E856